MKKWVISDMDGTILRHNDNGFIIEDITVKAINHLIDNNQDFEFTVATGRSSYDVMDIFKLFNINTYPSEFIIGMNGAQIYSVKDKKLIKAYLMSNKEMQMVNELYSQLEKDFQSFLLFGYNMLENEPKSMFYITKGKEDDRKVKTIIDYEGKDGSFTNHFIDNPLAIKDVYKYVIYIEDNIDINEYVKKCLKMFPELNFFKTGPNYIEIGRKDVSKLVAINYIRDNHYHISKENTYALGDSGNDLEMLQDSKISCTRFDADEVIKKACSHVYQHKASNFVGVAIEDIIKKVI